MVAITCCSICAQSATTKPLNLAQELRLPAFHLKIIRCSITCSRFQQQSHQLVCYSASSKHTPFCAAVCISLICIAKLIVHQVTGYMFGQICRQDRQHALQAPPLPLVNDFCQQVASWLQKHPQNVAVVHCKAGKGRTGTMICSYLVYAVSHLCICQAAWRIAK